MEFKYLRETQMALLEMAKDVDQLCRKHNIPYWISTGTVLGAVRNKGFIEWDDDLDLCFLIDDYHRMLKVLREELVPNHPHFILYNENRPFPHYSEYLADTRIVRDNLYPVKIDLIKVKSLPNTPEALQKDRDYLNLLAFMFDKKKELLVKDRDMIQKYLYEGSFLFKRERFMKDYIEYVDSLNKVEKDHVFVTTYNDMIATKEVKHMHYDHLFPVKEIDFETYPFFGPNDLEVYLTNLYGKDYINPPPVNQREPFAKKLSKSVFSKSMSKKLMWTLYAMKAVKGSFSLASKIKKLNKAHL
ncbi:LicD family protein [Brumimicrobium oceani]|uniref:LicD/FKTN/FKRP nucleotidyltransferase domain-containing protein n=1 Tax=Brumimicrobium oceani TaxID=2100725 RepID=A0A2U2XGY3_9FLAO|nr:LicD family protein [Brumimicrobium oceani]PWH87000.1 hypothetical protein DIT68_01715 [Brumimicrobium oceani]